MLQPISGLITAARAKRASALNETAASSDWRWPRLGVLASSRFRRLSREFLWIGLGQAATVLGAVVGVRILTGILTPQAYGELALGMTMATLVTQTVLGPLSNGATRFFSPAIEAGASRSYLAAVRSLLRRATGGIVLFTLVACLGLVATGHAAWVGLVVAAASFGLVSGYNSVLNGMQNAARQRAVVALHQAMASCARFLLAAGMVLWLGASSTTAMVGYVAAILLVLASQKRFFHCTLWSQDQARARAQALDQDRWRTAMLSYAWPFITWAFLEWARLASGRWGLQIFCTTREVGLYAVLYQLGYYPLTLFTQLATSFLAPIYFQRIGDASDPTRIQGVHGLGAKLMWGAIITTLLATGTAALLHRQLFALLVAEEYRSVSFLLPGLILAGGLGAAARFITTLFQARLRVKDLIVPRVVSETLGLSGNIVGAALLGVPGVVLANVVYALVSLLWIALLFRRIAVRLKKEE